MTLAFLGGRPEREIEAITACGLGTTEGLSAPVLVPGHVRGLPRRAPRLFALELGDEGGGAAALQAVLSGALAEAGHLEPERRPFWPHVTIARVRGAAARGGRRVPPLGAPPSPADRLTCAVVTLYRSHLSPKGARYEALARRELRVAGP